MRTLTLPFRLTAQLKNAIQRLWLDYRSFSRDYDLYRNAKK